MHGLNGFNLKKMFSEGERVNVPSTSSNLPLDDKTAIRFMIKKTKRFNYSIRVNDAEEAEQNHFEDKQMNGIQGEEINNISSSLYRLLCARITQTPGNRNNTPGNHYNTQGNQKNTPENQINTPGNQNNTQGNQENTPAKKSESDFVFLKPKVYRCYYCHKLFFHTTTYRRHMIAHLKKLHWCSICKRGFVSITLSKKHRLFYYGLMCKTLR